MSKILAYKKQSTGSEIQLGRSQTVVRKVRGMNFFCGGRRVGNVHRGTAKGNVWECLENNCLRWGNFGENVQVENNCPGWGNFFNCLRDVQGQRLEGRHVRIHVEDYKSPCVAVLNWATLVNRQTNTRTQTAFERLYTVAQKRNYQRICNQMIQKFCFDW